MSTDRGETKESLRQHAIDARNDYRTNGAHATPSEADAWLAELEAGKGVDPPECHA
jgi:hypothetical protein